MMTIRSTGRSGIRASSAQRPRLSAGQFAAWGTATFLGAALLATSVPVDAAQKVTATQTAAAAQATAAAQMVAAVPASGSGVASTTSVSAKKAAAGPQRPAGFSTKVMLPSGPVDLVSSAACSRRAVGVNFASADQMGPNGASQSQTLIAVPVGAGGAPPIANATTQAQISEVCNDQRR